jgi:hypothetical protein
MPYRIITVVEASTPDVEDNIFTYGFVKGILESLMSHFGRNGK